MKTFFFLNKPGATYTGVLSQLIAAAEKIPAASFTLYAVDIKNKDLDLDLEEIAKINFKESALYVSFSPGRNPGRLNRSLKVTTLKSALIHIERKLIKGVN